jgi:hypothetical protein
MDVIWWVATVVGVIAVNLIASELFAWGPRLSEWLMRRAVRRLAPEMQERMHQEWAGLLQTIPPGLWRIVEAAGFSLATRQINVALRVRERQEKPEEKTVWEEVSEKIERTEGTAFDVDIKFSVGMGKSAMISKYLNDYVKVWMEDRFKEGNKARVIGLYPGNELESPSIKVWVEDRFKEGNKARVIGLYPGDEPEPPSKPTPPKR